ncbi:hypothetical protein [Streptomyces spiramyceticus]|uniref:hypothetical protein n=1 Tax=Streptomyces spiramyceticus TaxID=299717 RepID=UPI00237A6953|nr:hypothetical protein [Streptomyces spiramyceticus]
MKKILEVVGFVLFVAGVSGVVHEVTGWLPQFFGFVRILDSLDFLKGRELYTNIVLAVVGVAVMASADRFRRI